MKAMILSAGLGTRMEELTRDRPKPMLPLLDVPLIAHALFLLYRQGCRFAAINTHYLGEQIEEYLSDFPYFPIQFSREDTLLGTGGGISRALHVTDLSGYFWVLNPDTMYLPEFSFGHIPSPAQDRNIDQARTGRAHDHSSADHSSAGHRTSMQPEGDQPFSDQAGTEDPAEQTPVLCLTHRPKNSRETGFRRCRPNRDPPGPPDGPPERFAIDFQSGGEYIYTGLALLHEAQFRSIPHHRPHHIVDDWRNRAAGAAGLEGFLFRGRLIDLGTRSDYLKAQKEELFPLTYRSELQEFMQTWKKDYG